MPARSTRREMSLDRRIEPRAGRSLAIPIHGVTFIGLAVMTSFFAYLWGSTSPNPAEVLAPGLFWYAVTLLLLAYPLRGAFAAFLRYIRTALGATVFTLYIVVHILLYGFMLESILVSFFDLPRVTTSLYVTTSVFAPPDLTNAVLGLWFNPWITFTIPPVLADAISFYSLDIALIIAVLIVANLGKTRELGRACSTSMKSRSMVILPAIGIVFGASCCLSVPVLVVLAVPSAVALSSTLWLYDITYFFFPLVGVVLLYLNLHSINRLTANANLSRPAAYPYTPGDRQSTPSAGSGETSHLDGLRDQR